MNHHIELELGIIFSNKYRKISIQRSPMSIFITLFPHKVGSQYEIITLNKIYKGIDQEVKIGPLTQAIEKHLKGK